LLHWGWSSSECVSYSAVVSSKRSPRPSRTVRKTKSAKKKPAAKGSKAPRAKRTRARPSATDRLAQRMAAEMPFTNFPARTRLETAIHWERLRSSKDLGDPQPSEDFKQLRWAHVFAYAGPSCYYSHHSTGDAVLYFQPGLDAKQQGSVAPFDSGSLEEPTPKLQPWAGRFLAERWAFLQAESHPLAGWRARFQEWLTYSYKDPARYLETSPDRYAAATPDRTRPSELLEHNGPEGVRKYGEGNCADRRAWIWEVRFESPVSFRDIKALHVARDRVRAATELMSRLHLFSGVDIEVIALPRGVDASADTLYEDSGRALRRLVGP